MLVKRKRGCNPFKIDTTTGELIPNRTRWNEKSALEVANELYEDLYNDKTLISLGLLFHMPKWREKKVNQNVWDHINKRFPKVKRVKEHMIDLIQQRMIQGAAVGDFKEGFVKWLLTTVHGMEVEVKKLEINETQVFKFGNPELDNVVQKSLEAPFDDYEELNENNED